MGPVGPYPDGAAELISAVIYGFRPDGVGVSLNDFEGRAEGWRRTLGLDEEGIEDLDETVRRVLEKIEAANLKVGGQH